MNCDEACRVISASADGEDRSTSAHDLEHHLQGCHHCRSFQATVGLVRGRLRVGDAGAGIDVTARVMAQLDRTVTHAGPTGDPRPEATSSGSAAAAAGVERHHSSARYLLVAAVLALVAVGGAFVAGRQGASARLTTDVETRPAADQLSPAATGEPPAPSPREGRADQDTATAGLARPGHVAVLWSPGRLEQILAATIAAESDLQSVTVRRGTVGLTASADGSGRPVDSTAPGWIIPIDAIAFDVDRYQRVMPAPQVARLGPGSVLLSSTSARLRRLDVGDRLWFADVELLVAGVVADDVIGGAELAADIETGRRLGLERERYLLLRLDDDVADPSSTMETLAARAEQLADGPVRFRTGDQVHYLRDNDAILAQADLKRTFGEFALRRDGATFQVDANWYNENVTTVELPLLGSVTCHRRLLPLLEAALAELAELAESGGGYRSGDQGRNDVAEADLNFGGCYNPRMIGGSDSISRHAWGAALDFGGLDASPDRRLVAALKRQGFSWGGDWLVPDSGHFEPGSP